MSDFLESARTYTADKVDELLHGLVVGAGAAGADGPPGPTGLNARGAWSTVATYAANDLVTLSGASYRAKVGNIGVSPVVGASSTEWELFAAGGASPARVLTSGSAAPSPTANTFGTSVQINPPAGSQGIGSVLSARATFTGTFASETVTAAFAAKYSDGTFVAAAAAPTVAATSASSQYGAAATLFAMYKDGAYLTGIAFVVKSSIANSQVTATGTVVVQTV